MVTKIVFFVLFMKHNGVSSEIAVKVKQSRYSPAVAQRVPGS
jgi:hypothetical protein